MAEAARYKFVSIYHNALRLTIPSKHGEDVCIVVDSDMSLRAIKQLVLDTLSSDEFSDDEINRLMRDWDSPEVTQGTRVFSKVQEKTKSGYLGVTPYVKHLVIGYTASFFHRGKIKNETFRMRLYPYLDHYSISRKELASAFIAACRHSDHQRGLSFKSDAEYLDSMKEINWEMMIRTSMEKKGGSFSKLTITDTPTSNYYYNGRWYISKNDLERSVGIQFKLRDVPSTANEDINEWHKWIAEKVARKTKPVPRFNKARIRQNII